MNMKTKYKMSGHQKKIYHDDWCNIGNQKTNNPNNQYPQKPSSNNASDEKNDDETTSDKFCNGIENVEDKHVERPPSRVLINESKTNSAVTPSDGPVGHIWKFDLEEHEIRNFGRKFNFSKFRMEPVMLNFLAKTENPKK